MGFVKLLSEKQAKGGSVCIAFLGDSITQGCFEILDAGDGKIDSPCEPQYAYHSYIKKMLQMLYPDVHFNIVNAGVGGENAPLGVKRLQKDVLDHKPDLTVVCFGLNDSCQGEQNLSKYTDALTEIFDRLAEQKIETIFMTPNTMNSYVSAELDKEHFRSIASQTMAIQQKGLLNLYLDAAKEICKKYEIQVCDCHKRWEALAENGVDTTRLLCNYINHPSREMQWLFAFSLMETIMNV